MSPLARVFVVVNLILSVFFFGSSATLFATRVNWRQKAIDFKDEAMKALKEVEDSYKKQGTRLVDLQKQHMQLTTNYNSVSADKTNLQTKLTEVQGQVDAGNVRIETEVKEKTQLLATQQDLQKRNTELAGLLETSRKEADEAKVAAKTAGDEYTRLRIDLDKLNGDYSKTLVELHELQEKADTMTTQIAAVSRRIPDVALTVSAPPIDGVIQAVKNEDKLVVLSVGKDQKVQEGYQFTVYRGDKFVGKVQVIKVYDDLAGARVLYTQDGEAIQVGDQAATQL